ncbi:MAG: DUF883 family protein [Stellaceae bacterium]
MNATSTASQTARDAAGESAGDARDAIGDVGSAANAAPGDIQKDLQALRDDFSRLAEQVRDILASKGNAAWRRAKTSVDGVVSDAQSKGQDAATAMREVSDNFIEAIDESIKDRPYTTLALAVGLGLVLGITWRR